MLLRFREVLSFSDGRTGIIKELLDMADGDQAQLVESYQGAALAAPMRRNRRQGSAVLVGRRFAHRLNHHFTRGGSQSRRRPRC